MKTDEQITDSDAPANLNSEEASAWACGYRSGYSAAHALQAQQVTATEGAEAAWETKIRTMLELYARYGMYGNEEQLQESFRLKAEILAALSRVPQPEPGKDTERLNAMEEALSKVEGCDWESIIGHAYAVGIRKSVDAHLAASTKGTGEGRV
jgi:hypothetical protein